MMKQKWLSLLLCVAMVMTMLPVTVWADSVPENFLFDISEGSVTIGNGTNVGTVKVTYGTGAVKDNIDPSQPITVTGTTTANNITVTGTTTANNITVTGNVSVTVVLQDLTTDVSGKNQTVAVNLDGAGAALPTDMTRRGYGFISWYKDMTGEQVTAISDTDWGNRSFTARWALGGTAPTYTVTIPATVELGGTVTVSC